MLISKFCRGTLTGGRFGIEIEVEGIDHHDYDYEGWQLHEEGSLRGGFEIVSRPLMIDDVRPALEKVKPILDNCVMSDRCSIHVHVNAGDLTTLGVTKLTSLFMCLERALIENYNMRGNNNYCVPFHHVNSPLQFAENMASCRSTINESYSKYMALNVLPLNRFGTVEFRGMGLLTDVDSIVEWVEVIHEIREMSQLIRIAEFINRGKAHLLEISEPFPRINDILLNSDVVDIGIIQAVNEVMKCAD